MILDQQSLFSDAQAITVSANSQNVIDHLLTTQLPYGAVNQPIGVLAQVNQPFAGGTSLQISLVSADDSALSSNVVTHLTTGVIPVASLTQGVQALAARVPQQKLRKYLGLKYTVVGTMTAGTITAGLVEDINSVMRTTDFTKGFSVA
ncbi:hypothetical protein QCE73_08915 [Caballeronia sp. LZ029]|uniref:Bbp16 family capsid cement protein n=1 Tax=Caballeronia sp. LZ029 TaxID=3038564 RepID=UPI0028590F78|nr:hypothetical protein [Caballeronia sp. LZ029]MDR5743274.1 hypothetical protein [Caballeronia sp. LZ029]